MYRNSLSLVLILALFAYYPRCHGLCRHTGSASFGPTLRLCCSVDHLYGLGGRQDTMERLLQYGHRHHRHRWVLHADWQYEPANPICWHFPRSDGYLSGRTKHAHMGFEQPRRRVQARCMHWYHRWVGQSERCRELQHLSEEREAQILHCQSPSRCRDHS